MQEILEDGCITSFCSFLYEAVITSKFGDKADHGDGYHCQIWY